MEPKIPFGEYVAPEINVLELQSIGVLCTSGENEEFSYEGAPGWFD